MYVKSRVIWIVVGIVVVGGAAIFLVNRDSTSTSGDTAPSGAGQTVRLTTSDGLDVTMDVTSCDNPGETSISLTAETESSDLQMDATGNSGTIFYESSDGNREGTVDSIQVGDTGSITASGSLGVADDSADPATFELTGQCA